MYRIVIADDEQVIRKGLLSMKWSENGMEVIAAAKNGVETEEIIDSREFDVLLTDIKMPGISGLELARNLAKTNPNAKTILLTGYGEFEYAKAAVNIGVFDYILKPSTPSEIMDCVKRACARISEEQKRSGHMQELQSRVRDYEQIVGVDQAVGDGKENDASIRDVLKYICANYQEELSLSVLAEHFHFSTVYLSYYIKKNTEHTFLEILTSVRMYHAARLLTETNLKNAEIGMRIGIPDERYMGQVFKKTYNMTPYEYKKQKIKPVISLQDVIDEGDIK